MAQSKKELFDLYNAADKKVELARAAVEEAIRERSITVENIVLAFGKGPFGVGQGKDKKSLKAVGRKIKDNGVFTGNYTWFFKAGDAVQMVEDEE